MAMRHKVWMVLSVVLVGALVCLPVSCTKAPQAVAATPTTAPNVTSPAPTATPAPPAMSIRLKATSYGVEGFTARIMVERAYALIKERSGGRLVIDYYPHTTLLTLDAQWSAVKNNIVQIGVTSLTYYPEELGILADTNAGPWCWDVTKFGQHWRDPGGFFDWQQPLFQKQGLLMLCDAKAPYSILFSRRPIHTLEDLKGKLIRCTGSQQIAMKALGAQPVMIPLTDMYEAMQRGTVDGGYQQIYTVVGGKYYEAGPYCTQDYFYTGSIVAIANLNWVNSLPPDLKKVIVESFRDAEAEYYTWTWDKYNEALADLKSKAKEVYILPPDELARWIKIGGGAYRAAMQKQYPDQWSEFSKFLDAMGM